MERVKQNDTFDIMKAIMALMITVIHIVALNKLGILGIFMFPILRTEKLFTQSNQTKLTVIFTLVHNFVTNNLLY